MRGMGMCACLHGFCDSGCQGLRLKRYLAVRELALAYHVGARIVRDLYAQLDCPSVRFGALLELADYLWSGHHCMSHFLAPHRPGLRVEANRYRRSTAFHLVVGIVQRLYLVYVHDSIGLWLLLGCHVPATNVGAGWKLCCTPDCKNQAADAEGASEANPKARFHVVHVTVSGVQHKTRGCAQWRTSKSVFFCFDV
jgi:hypothetical protein